VAAAFDQSYHLASTCASVTSYARAPQLEQAGQRKYVLARRPATRGVLWSGRPKVERLFRIYTTGSQQSAYSEHCMI
jgi:hypothetical protein